ncbi:tyrosine-protein phosphatase [Endozoicomonas sp.]|uniref:tyrosine-protein phosphatase n=1 Tax=Endozoicomonas sp. TaxID=1892382 RepID=UPI003AF52F8E
MDNTGGIGVLRASQIEQINKLASGKGNGDKVLVATLKGRKVKFSAVKAPKASSKSKQSKPIKGADEAIKRLGIRDRKSITVSEAKQYIQSLKKEYDLARGSAVYKALVEKRSNSEISLSDASADSPPPSTDPRITPPPLPPRTPPPLPPRTPQSSLLSKQQSHYQSTTSVDSGLGNSISGSTQSLDSLVSDLYSSEDKQTTSLSKEVTQLVNDGKYKLAHQQLAQESLQTIKGRHIKDGRWKRFGYKDQAIGNVPLPKKTALKIDGSYIPANKITLHNANYIAIQAPQTGYGGDIWKSAIDSSSSIICDLTGDNDKAGFRKGGPIDKYYPTNENREINFNNGVKVIFKGQAQGNGYTKTRYEVTDPSGKTRMLRRYNYTEWPDHGVPSEKSGKDSLLQYIKALNTHQKSPDYTGNTMVHCTAGVGRTGTLIVLNEMYQDIQSGKYKNQTEVDKAVFEAIQQGRKDRGPAFVQSDSQIEFIMDIVHTWQDQQSRGEALIP